jgi:tol-pal system protein YbgF
VTPVAGLSSRMDQMSSDLHTLGNAVSDLTGTLAKMQTLLTDLNNAMKVLQTPAPPPPASTGAPASGAAAPAAVSSISATDLYNNADRDRNGGHLDLAVQEFSDFLKYYPGSAQAAAAQFYIGFIHYGQKDFESAAQDFESVAKNYPDDATRVPEALYYKGMSLQHSAHKTEASQVYKELIKQFPDNDNATKACTQLQSLGIRCAGPAAAPVRKKK